MDKKGVVSPNYTIDAVPILRPYLDKSGLTVRDLSGQGLEILLAAWIISLTNRERSSSPGQPDWLINSGLQEALTGGRLAQGVSA